MSNLYDDYVWRLTSVTPSFDIMLPQDLEWIDEFTWTPVKQNVSTSLSGGLIIQESVQSKGRPLTLQGKDDMAWVKRSVGNSLLQMRDTAGLVMRLEYRLYENGGYGAVLFGYDVMFRHYEPPVIDLESVKRFDNFEPDSWFQIRALRFMEAVAGAAQPCTANSTLMLSGITGTFNIGQTVTGGDPEISGIVLGFTNPTLQLYVADGEYITGDIITGPSGSGTVA